MSLFGEAVFGLETCDPHHHGHRLSRKTSVGADAISDGYFSATAVPGTQYMVLSCPRHQFGLFHEGEVPTGVAL